MSAELTASLTALGAVPVAVEESGFRPLVEAPHWLDSIQPWDFDNFAILECVVPDFESYWEDPNEQAVPFGPWEQEGSDGAVALEVQPVRVPGQRVMLLRNLGKGYEEHSAILQKARDNLLVHEALEREIKKKEFLLHTIVHDLAGPLTSMKGAMHILKRQGLPSESVAELLAIGMRQADRQEKMIREILEVFAAEVDSLNDRKVETTADPLTACEGVAESLRPAFNEKGVGLSCQGTQCQVVGDDAKLERVISNLTENALRNVPEGKSVALSVSVAEDFATVEVSDDGPGVPPEAAKNLFKKMAKGKKGGGKIGLGLYFCKLTVQAWGGEIGYRPSESGGACFWFKLPLAELQ